MLTWFAIIQDLQFPEFVNYRVIIKIYGESYIKNINLKFWRYAYNLKVMQRVYYIKGDNGWSLSTGKWQQSLQS